MIIKLDGATYTVPPEQEARIIQQMHQAGADTYDKQGLEFQLLVTAVARWVLSKWETAVRKTQGKEASLALRPPKKTEPALYLSSMLARQMQAMVRNAELTIETDGQNTTTAFSFSIPTADKAGGSLVSDGNVREREDYRAQIS